MRVTSLSNHGVRALNEDAVLVDEQRQLFGVFDGASSLVPFNSPDGKTGAYLAAHKAAEVFKNSTQPLNETALLANEAIEAMHKDYAIDLSDGVNRFGTTAAVVRISDKQMELLQVGDSVVIVIDSAGVPTLPLGYHDHDLQVMQKWRQFADSGATNIRSLVADDVIELRRTANTAYGSLNGDSKLKDFIQTTTISLDNVSTILLLTDGMFIPKPDPDTPEDWQQITSIYKQDGLQGIFDCVRKIELTDPELVTYPRYKLHDDASAIAVDL